MVLFALRQIELQWNQQIHQPAYAIPHKHWVQGLGLNQGPSGYEPDLDVVYKQNKKETVSLKEVCNETYGSVVEAVSELMEEGEKAYSF